MGNLRRYPVIRVYIRRSERERRARLLAEIAEPEIADRAITIGDRIGSARQVGIVAQVTDLVHGEQFLVARKDIVRDHHIDGFLVAAKVEQRVELLRAGAVHGFKRSDETSGLRFCRGKPPGRRGGGAGGWGGGGG